ncbi:MAG: hypothetical protein O2931_09430 [Planctomycetota bacterium]|nr:hypothetical protein [Planctomycetota bacterium]MDA1179003.1 hypothetical protein [Planctomycetota bacterium]
MSVNIFSHDVGSRIILGYKHEKPEPVVPPLAPVDSPLAKRNNNGTPVDAKDELPAKVPVDATRNTGSATVMLGATKYEFKHVAAYRTKSDGDGKTVLLFSQRPIPLQQLQDLITKSDDVSMSDVFKSMAPEHMTISYGESVSFHLNVGGTAISVGIRSPDDTLKVEGDRIRGEMRMPKPQEVFDESVQLSARIDAAIITRNTMLSTTSK